MGDAFDGERSVVVVGAGAAGTLVATHLLTSLGPRHRVDLVDPTPERVGPAYATTDERHLLNVPASGMSAVTRDPDHFLRWLRRTERTDFQPHEFAPRAAYGRYLADLLERAAEFPSNARLVRHRATVQDVVPTAGGFRVQLAEDEVLCARAVVLAPGAEPGTSWAPAELVASPRFVPDPWAAPLSELVPEGGDVLLVGTGLTMVDLAISLDTPGRTLHTVSRTDTLPERHVVPTVPPVPPPPGITRRHGLAALTRALENHIARTVEQTGDWRSAVDGLRPVTAQLWRGLPESDKQDFVRTRARRWDTHRHRMSPATAARFDAVLDSGRLHRHTGTVVAARTLDDSVEVRLDNGQVLRVAAVLNCTGPHPGLSGSALLTTLASAGTVRPGPVGPGIETTEEGRVLGSRPGQDLYALGALRKGTLWESTAVPEIRDQAWDVARAVARSLQGIRGGARTDTYGLPLSTTSVAAGWYDRALHRLLRLQSGVDDALAEAVDVDRDFAHAHAARALLAHEWRTGADAGASLRAAHTAAGRRDLDDREASFLDAVSTRLRGDEAGGAAALLRHIRIFPRDALAVSVAVPTVAFGGLTAGSQTTELVEWLGKAYGDDWWYAGQLAFVRQDQGRWAEAEDLTAHALSLEPASGHAVHARSHVFYETGQHRAGLEWLDGWLQTHGPRAFSRSHFEWHAALHELMTDDIGAARARYERALRPDLVGATRAVVDSGSLLWRGRMTGSWPGTLRAPALRHEVPAGWLSTPPTPFAALHTALTLAVTDDAHGLLDLQRFAERHEDPTQREVVAPLAQALLHVVEEDWRAAADLLTQVLHRTVELGGSAAQREVLEETQVYVLTRAGRTREAAALLDARLERRPSPLDTRRLAALGPRPANQPA